MSITINSISHKNRENISKFIKDQWFTTDMVIRGQMFDMTKLDGFAVYDDECEISYYK